jgi:hypothetical protein
MKTFKQYLREDDDMMHPPGPPNPPSSVNPGSGNPNLPQHDVYNPSGYKPGTPTGRPPKLARPGMRPSTKPYTGERVDPDDMEWEDDDIIDAIDAVIPGPDFLDIIRDVWFPQGPDPENGPLHPSVPFEPWGGPLGSPPPAGWYHDETAPEGDPDKWFYRPNPGGERNPHYYDWNPNTHEWQMSPYHPGYNAGRRDNPLPVWRFQPPVQQYDSVD